MFKRKFSLKRRLLFKIKITDMKTGIRKLYYAGGGGAEYQERIEIWHCYYSGKHGRYKKDKNLSRRVRRMTKHVDYNEFE